MKEEIQTRATAHLKKSEMEVTLKNTEMPRYTIVFKIDKNAMLKI